MTTANYSAFAALSEKNGNNKVYRVRATARLEGVGADAVVILSLPLREVEQARPGTGQRRSLGFALGPCDFSLPDGSVFTLNAGWVSLNVR